jgi:hypothetical protein
MISFHQEPITTEQTADRDPFPEEATAGKEIDEGWKGSAYEFF